MRCLNLWAVSCASLLALAACGGRTEVTSSGSDDPEVGSSSGGGTGFLEASVDALWTTSFLGTRLVTLNHTQPGVQYREEVGADGEGNFSIITLEVLTPHPDPDLFLAVQDLRQTLSFRYRDFAIKDWDLFTQEYAVAIVDDHREVAGIPTVQVRVDRMTERKTYYEVDFDPVTSLVLAYTERDMATGALIAEVAFEALEYLPDLTGHTLISHLYPTTEHSISGGNLDAVFDFDPLIPSYVPPGYRVLDTLERQEAPDGPRAKVYLTDGLEVIVVASQKPMIGVGAPPPSRVWSTDLGSWTGMIGDAQGYPVMTAGKVDSLQQSLMLQSALD